MRHVVVLCLALSLGLFMSATLCAAETPAPVHGLAMRGAPKYPAGFSHFDYVNPNAPKGGEIRLSETGGWDSFNPFIVKGEAAGGSELPFETLMIESADEPFSEYGLLAESIEMPADRSWVAFTLRSKARWHDGKPITADDVVFSFDILKSKGHPRFRFYYAAVDKVEKVGERKVRFSFKPGDNRELPLILGQLPVLPKHYWKGRDFAATTLQPPLGSGPYKAGPFETGRSVTWVRVKDYWGTDLPVRRGQYNFDRIRYDSYRDTTVALEAFKAGEYDWRMEMEAKKWATGYQDWSGLKDGRGFKEVFPNQRPAGMQGYVYNLRRPLFQDPRVREALALAFDFEWTNKTLFYGQYKRTASFFANSEMASTGLPGPKELEVLEPLRDKVPPQVFTTTYKPPETEGDGNIRANLRAAMRLLEEAGWTVENGKLVKDGRPFVFEILLNQPIWERIALPFARNLERLGIEANVRVVDTAQYKNRVDQYDYDMVVQVWGQSQSPGNEQVSFWGSTAAAEVGGQNLAGIQNPAVDALVAAIIAAPDRETLVAYCRALDRVLLWNHYVIPQWHMASDRVAWWDKFGRPAIIPAAGVRPLAWWSKDAEKK
ncbi:extracellular solute-binding protein [Magnetospirillum molischianum]|uniref:Putative oligopeptide transport protein (ABC superfamily, peri_bind) n=1 Tax=Magnetospirillum molischianum DSM 120 TaxID=1150626 RepID=H8FQS6_MAGML|nr:extracellular solute-binding protein [Magnetospirillum molischianum]CCG40714.1 putative oligopeptide transport protein (ABC superfamily, peri_bind) [Magnetospirillum molischianum DSM 120]